MNYEVDFYNQCSKTFCSRNSFPKSQSECLHVFLNTNTLTNISGSLAASGTFRMLTHKQTNMAGVFFFFSRFHDVKKKKKRVNNQNSCIFWSRCILQMFGALYGIKTVFPAMQRKFCPDVLRDDHSEP